MRLKSTATGYCLCYSKDYKEFIVYDNDNNQLYCGSSEDEVVAWFSENPYESEKKFNGIVNHIYTCSKEGMSIIKISGQVFNEIMNSSWPNFRFVISQSKKELFGSTFGISIRYRMIYSVE